MIEPDTYVDDRGVLEITYSESEFSKNGLNTKWVGRVTTTTKGIGIVRGMHWQAEPHSQIKLVRCVAGKVIDVIVDIRKKSELFGIPVSVELTKENGKSIYIPSGFAHGFQCLSDECVMDYLLSDKYSAEYSRSFNPCYPSFFSFKWPLSVSKLSVRDSSAPSLSDVLQCV